MIRINLHHFIYNMLMNILESNVFITRKKSHLFEKRRHICQNRTNTSIQSLNASLISAFHNNNNNIFRVHMRRIWTCEVQCDINSTSCRETPFLSWDVVSMHPLKCLLRKSTLKYYQTVVILLLYKLNEKRWRFCNSKCNVSLEFSRC